MGSTARTEEDGGMHGIVRYCGVDRQLHSEDFCCDMGLTIAHEAPPLAR
jgi:hypothetical protein